MEPVAHVGEIINVYRIEFRKPERKSPLGRYTVRTVVSSRVVASFLLKIRHCLASLVPTLVYLFKAQWLLCVPPTLNLNNMLPTECISGFCMISKIKSYYFPDHH